MVLCLEYLAACELGFQINGLHVFKNSLGCSAVVEEMNSEVLGNTGSGVR